jgi:hypothetical protein
MGGVVDRIGGMIGLSSGDIHGKEAGAIPKPSFGISGGLFGGGGYDAATGDITLDPSALSRLLGGQLTGQASELLGQVGGAGQEYTQAGERALGALGTFDPYAAAEEQFNRLDAILEPGRAQTRAGTAAGLLATGRLGSTAGARTQSSVEGEIERQRQSLLGDAWGQAQATQTNLANLATGLGAFGLQRQQGTQQLGLGALTGAMGLDSQLQAMLGLGSNISSPAGISQAQPGMLQAGIGGLMTGIGSTI